VPKILTTLVLAWALWSVEQLERMPELPLDVVKLSVHDTQAACEERATARRQWQEELYQQQVKDFDWAHKPWPGYMQRRLIFTCIPT